MESSPEPESASNDLLKVIRAEHRQLLACLWSFRLLSAGLLLQLVCFFWQAGEMPTSDAQIGRYPNAILLSLGIGLLAFLLIPVSWLWLRTSRSTRWWRAAAGMMVVVAADLACRVVLVILCPIGEPIREPEPLPLRLALLANGIVGWGELWFAAVVISEFSIACRVEGLVGRAEFTGYTVFAGLCADLALAAWILPNPVPRLSINEMTGTLAFVSALASLLALIISLALAVSAAQLASLMLYRCSKQKSIAEDYANG